MTGTGYVVSAGTKNPQAAWELMKWYLTGDEAGKRAEAAADSRSYEATSICFPRTAT